MPAEPPRTMFAHSRFGVALRFFIPGIHQVNETAPDSSVWDSGFQASGLLLLAIGALLIRQEHEDAVAASRSAPPAMR